VDSIGKPASPQRRQRARSSCSELIEEYLLIGSSVVSVVSEVRVPGSLFREP